MPNWCEQDLLVKGKTAELAKFKEYAKSEESLLDANCFIPYPEEYAFLDKLSPATEDNIPERVMARLQGFNLKKDGFNQGGHEWCSANWGSKWGFCDVELKKETSRSLYYNFRSAWSSLTPLLVKMGQIFPQLEFKLSYYEMGEGYQGKLHMKNGKVNHQSHGDYRGNRGG